MGTCVFEFQILPHCVDSREFVETSTVPKTSTGRSTHEPPSLLRMSPFVGSSADSFPPRASMFKTNARNVVLLTDEGEIPIVPRTAHERYNTYHARVLYFGRCS